MARPRPGFNRILLTPVALLVALAFGMAALLGAVYGERATHFLVEQLVAKSTEGLHTHLQRFLEKPHLVVKVNVDGMRFGEIDPKGLFAKPEDWFFRQHQQFPEIDDVYFGRSDGAIVGIDKTDGRLVLKLTTDFPKRVFYALDVHGRRWGEVAGGVYDARQREWYRAAVARPERGIWSAVYVLQNKNALGITAARAAVDAQGTPVGVMGVNLTLASISDYLRSHPVASRSMAYIVDGEGLLVASASDAAAVVALREGKPARVAAAQAADPLVAASYAALQRLGPDAGGRGAGQGVDRSTELRVGEQNHWVYVTRYTDSLGLDWRLVSVVDPAPFLTGVRLAAQGTLVVGGVLLAVLALLVPRVTRRLATPIEQLSAAARRIADGHYGEPVPAVGGGREIGTLVEAFDHMSGALAEADRRLKAQAADLERQVAERTEALARSNEALARSNEALSQSNQALAQAGVAADAASRAKSAFIASLSHEIRTPLNTITGLAYLMRGEPLPESLRRRLSMIEDAGQYLLQVVNAQLDLATIEAGKLALACRPVDVAALLAQVVALVETPARIKGLALRSEVDPALALPLAGDPTRLQQALLNYAANAVRHTLRGEVVLRAALVAQDAGGALLRFEVSDTGPGVDPARLPGLFAPFERLPSDPAAGDDPLAAPAGGTGLGLAITRALARAMGGDAGAESMPGMGSRFHFTARLHRATPDAPPLPAPPPSSAAALDALRGVLAARAAPARLLLVEDDPVGQMIALAMLAQAGIDAQAAADGQQALEHCAAADVDLVLMDLQLPGIDGLETTRRLRRAARNGAVPVVALTANAFEQDRRRCAEAGMDDFVGKPLDPRELFEVLARWLRPAVAAAAAEAPPG